MSPGAPAGRAESPGDARAYHDETKHSRASVRTDRHTLDWANKPFLFKVYPDAPAVPLPREVAPPTLPALEAVARGVAVPGEGRVDLTALAQLLFFSAGLTKRKVYPGGEAMHFRAAASTGALYQTEVYVVAGAVDGLEPGVYHFCPGDFTLRRLRAGDHRAALAEATGRGDLVADAPATAILTAIHWRNTWKYRARAFRHFFWDAGTLLANLLATAVALDVSARVLLGYADSPVNGLLGIDAAREGALALVPLGRGAGPRPRIDRPRLGSVCPRCPCPRGKWSIRSSTKPTRPRRCPTAARRVRGSPAPGTPPPWPPLPRASRRGLSGRRSSAADPPASSDGSRSRPRSSRRSWRPRCDRCLSISASARRWSRRTSSSTPPNGLTAGAYVWDRATRGLRLLKAGEFREVGGYLCLEQPLGADASAVAFFLSDLAPVLARWGSRGYRAVNLAAGLLGGRLYLGAYSLGLGATGLTFYDDEVVQFFEPHAAGKDAIFVTALGAATRRPAGARAAGGPGLARAAAPGRRLRRGRRSA